MVPDLLEIVSVSFDDRPDLSFNALNIVSSNLQNIAEVFNRNIETYDETETRTVTKQRFVKGNRAKRGGWGALLGGAVGFLFGGPLGAAAGAAIGGGTGAGTGSGDHWEDYQTTETYTNKVDYVDMSKVVKAYQPKVSKQISELKDDGLVDAKVFNEYKEKFTAALTDDVNTLISIGLSISVVETSNNFA